MLQFTQIDTIACCLNVVSRRRSISILLFPQGSFFPKVYCGGGVDETVESREAPWLKINFQIFDVSFYRNAEADLANH